MEDEDFYDPEADAALFDALREHLDPGVELVEMETDVNDEEFALTIARKLDEYMRDVGRARDGSGPSRAGSAAPSSPSGTVRSPAPEGRTY